MSDDQATAMTPGTQLTAHKAELVAGAPVTAIVPRTVDEVARVARAVIVAGLAPNSYQGRNEQETVSKIMIGVMKGAEVGLAPITALSTIAIINNRPCIWGDGAVALCQRHSTIEWTKTRYEGKAHEDNYVCIVEVKRRGQDEPYVGTFSVADAKRAKLWANPSKAPWLLYPDRMMFNRARAFALRDGFADCLMGLSIAEEVRDLPEAPQAPDITFLDDKVSPATPPAIPAEAGEAAGIEAEAPPPSAPAAPSSEPDDWKQWADSLIEQIAKLKPEDVKAFRGDIAEQLAKAPPAFQGQINRRLREKEKQMVAA